MNVSAVILEENAPLLRLKDERELKVLYHNADKLYFQINSKNFEEVKVSLFNSAGRIIHSSYFLVESGISTHEINIYNFPSGIYMLQLIQGSKISNQQAQLVR